jgi:hypothetical protein
MKINVEVAPNNTWLPIALADLLEGIGGGIVAPHSQSSPSSLHLVRVLKERGKLDLLKGIITPEGGTDLAAAGLVGSDFDTIPFLMMNGDYRPMAFREGNYTAVAAMNASPTRKVGPALVVSGEDPRFEGKFNGHTHMGMLGSTALAQFDRPYTGHGSELRDRHGSGDVRKNDIRPNQGPSADHSGVPLPERSMR